MRVCWISIDPVRRKLDIYPRAIAIRIEKAYLDRDPFVPSSCVLGSDFFNATVHFHTNGSTCQTTPGMSLGRSGFKQPGYRSVKRCQLCDGDTTELCIFSKKVDGEWRIANSETYEVKFEELIPPECMITSSNDIFTSMNSYNALNTKFVSWSQEDLDYTNTEDTSSTPVSTSDLISSLESTSITATNKSNEERVVWQWCRGVPERQGDIIKLDDEWWCPYMYKENKEIEEAFSNDESFLNLDLPIQNGKRTIIFICGNPYATQIDPINKKERLMRRIVKTVAEIKIMFENIKNPPVCIDELIANLPDGSIPHHFFCSITQDIMKDPVKTIDGHIYDRHAIERWFQEHSTSPLTGLPLSSKGLIPNITIKKQIEKFIEDLKNNTNLAPAPAPPS